MILPGARARHALDIGQLLDPFLFQDLVPRSKGMRHPTANARTGTQKLWDIVKTYIYIYTYCIYIYINGTWSYIVQSYLSLSKSAHYYCVGSVANKMQLITELANV